MEVIGLSMDNLEQLESLIKTQCMDGNWDYSPYMHGLANGMILSNAILKDINPVLLERPPFWLQDKKDLLNDN